MSKPPIEDYYGTQISVEVCGHSVGFMVDLDRDAKDGVEAQTFDSFTAGQARDLAARLIEAAEEIEAHS